MTSRTALDEFVDQISNIRETYVLATVSYVLIRTGTLFHVIRARLSFSFIPVSMAGRNEDVDEYVCGAFDLAETGLDFESFMSRLLGGSFVTPEKTYSLLGFDASASSGAQNSQRPNRPQMHLVQTNNSSQKRISTLRISNFGLPQNALRKPSKWKLRGSLTPYDSEQDLLSSFGFGDLFAQIEVVAPNPVEIDVNSRVKGDVAQIAIYAPAHVAKSDLSISCIINCQGAITERRALAGTDLEWEGVDRLKCVLGKGYISVPRSSIVHCFANYKGECYHDYWINDPDAPQNHVRAVLEIFDPGLNVSGEILRQEVRRGESRDVEAVVSWTLSMLGFSAIRLGDIAKLSDGPDVVAFAPSGGVLVVECTRSALNDQKKLQNLLDRTSRIEQRLKDTGNLHFDVLPVMVTTRSNESVSSDASHHRLRGVVVLTIEDFESLTKSTLLRIDANSIFLTWKSELQNERLRASERERKLDKAIQSI